MRRCVRRLRVPRARPAEDRPPPPPAPPPDSRRARARGARTESATASRTVQTAAKPSAALPPSSRDATTIPTISSTKTSSCPARGFAGASGGAAAEAVAPPRDPARDIVGGVRDDTKGTKCEVAAAVLLWIFAIGGGRLATGGRHSGARGWCTHQREEPRVGDRLLRLLLDDVAADFVMDKVANAVHGQKAAAASWDRGWGLREGA